MPLLSFNTEIHHEYHASLIAHRAEWGPQAACLEAEKATFFPEEHYNQIRVAMQWCFDCPVRLQCAEWALAYGEADGVWGGLSEHERRNAAKEARRVFRADPAVWVADNGKPLQRFLRRFFANRVEDEDLLKSTGKPRRGRGRSRTVSL